MADLPVDLRCLVESGAVTFNQLTALHSALGVTSAGELLAELRRHSIRRTTGLGESVETAVQVAFSTLRAQRRRVSLDQALAVAKPIVDLLGDTEEVSWAEVAGSTRRGQDSVGDVAIVAATDTPDLAMELPLEILAGVRCTHRSSKHLYVDAGQLQVGVRFASIAEAGATLLTLTGSRTHVEELRQLAAARGWSLELEGLRRGNQVADVGRFEHDIYGALGLSFVPPELREGAGEVDLAREGSLPTLVKRSDLRGDLHMHTDWSDGRHSIDDMVQAGLALGYEYVAITDHSQNSAASRNLTEDDVRRQADEIEKLREIYPTIAILHGCEVDILPSGALDFSDSILRGFDIVLASLHDAAGQAPRQLLERYLRAMRHPLVGLITHPTNRMGPFRQGYDLDYERLFAVAVQTGTAVEIDGAPSHLDLDAGLSRRAAAAGVTLAIDSDCHRAEMLGPQMDLGILTARRGWVESCQVLNARPLAELRAFLAAKRGF